MVTAKKTTTTKAAPKKATTKKAPVTKAAPVKKAPVKKTVAKKTSSKSATAKTAAYNSFKPSTDVSNFTNFKVTRQTVYWIILIAFIIFAQLWILKLQIDVATLLDAQQTELISE